ncbi:hypothetical protein SR42_09850 [Clostridium botulinum]|uniref:hypothetical protein n=1 Tax=Clostridium botulinum TaxID=1491 RepID=UPI0005978D88|nr:hypothetical protein [Clostridium botulinum]KIL09258.1 hypothetical protein SR42_09850 [Clostridium botulinum]MBY6932958.1 hypothetical protein [Clostridium botulinum]NFL82248.1 hypothetical protein [Clostridium botulinum]NFN10761.1 hypothetical protein [Clostridium botulinum]NFO36106.1 hypothetical protein [Clostridium botulinum]
MLDKSIVDLKGDIIYSHILMDGNNNILFSDIEIEITEDMQIVDIPNKTYIKPKWTGIEWVETATEEEIKEHEEANKPKPKEPNETERLQKQLLETQNMLLELQEQILLNKQIK